MIYTKEQKREVANRLRYWGQHATTLSIHEILYNVLGVGGCDALKALADLIEPEPERTCHIKISDCTDSLGQKMYRCSECGSLTTDDACFFEGEPDIDGFSYCPNCGAKVVDV